MVVRWVLITCQVDETMSFSVHRNPTGEYFISTSQERNLKPEVSQLTYSEIRFCVLTFYTLDPQSIITSISVRTIAPPVPLQTNWIRTCILVWSQVTRMHINTWETLVYVIPLSLGDKLPDSAQTLWLEASVYFLVCATVSSGVI